MVTLFEALVLLLALYGIIIGCSRFSHALADGTELVHAAYTTAYGKVWDAWGVAMFGQPFSNMASDQIHKLEILGYIWKVRQCITHKVSVETATPVAWEVVEKRYEAALQRAADAKHKVDAANTKAKRDWLLAEARKQIALEDAVRDIRAGHAV
jgi:hypothetical protein